MSNTLKLVEEDFIKKSWWNYIDRDLKELLEQSKKLIIVFEKNKGEFLDYSFIVFPAAKAYEGFLKKIFFDLKFITKEEFFGRHFRIGKSLNPFLPKDMESESVYKKIVEVDGNNVLADTLWNTWKLSRNSTFHWFPEEKNAISFFEAKKRTELVVAAIDEAFGKLKPTN